ncbi:hypothetical protein B0H11DRAFT_1911908 [Mycena galericulata]|nr:hypothetical protein B0H11DRAFT_1911908 [Mycena galericulata]
MQHDVILPTHCALLVVSCWLAVGGIPTLVWLPTKNNINIGRGRANNPQLGVERPRRQANVKGLQWKQVEAILTNVGMEDEKERSERARAQATANSWFVSSFLPPYCRLTCCCHSFNNVSNCGFLAPGSVDARWAWSLSGIQLSVPICSADTDHFCEREPQFMVHNDDGSQDAKKRNTSEELRGVNGHIEKVAWQRRAAQFAIRDGRCVAMIYLPLNYAGLDLTIIVFFCTSLQSRNSWLSGHGQHRNAARNKVTTMALLHERTLQCRVTDTIVNVNQVGRALCLPAAHVLRADAAPPHGDADADAAASRRTPSFAFAAPVHPSRCPPPQRGDGTAHPPCSVPSRPRVGHPCITPYTSFPLRGKEQGEEGKDEGGRLWHGPVSLPAGSVTLREKAPHWNCVVGSGKILLYTDDNHVDTHHPVHNLLESHARVPCAEHPGESWEDVGGQETVREYNVDWENSPVQINTVRISTLPLVVLRSERQSDLGDDGVFVGAGCAAVHLFVRLVHAYAVPSVPGSAHENHRRAWDLLNKEKVMKAVLVDRQAGELWSEDAAIRKAGAGLVATNFICVHRRGGSFLAYNLRLGPYRS